LLTVLPTKIYYRFKLPPRMIMLLLWLGLRIRSLLRDRGGT